MRRNSYSWGCRKPKTTAELRENQEGWERPCRRNLPTWYDDLPKTYTKSWKDKRKTQYYPGGRGKHNQVRIDKVTDCRTWLRWYHSPLWNLEEYLQDHNIPYRTDTYREWVWKEIVEIVYLDEYEIIDYGWWKNRRRKRKTIHTGEYYKHYFIKYYIVNWWYDKDIGVEFILNMEGD